ncbi:hypothetical protein CH267_02220 [Rhodococcus sp. 06-621-2]|nr:hypothetical protein [Rhodococcus sp. 06-621-2]OZC62375.1 hypothetical protein CH267_02220 [Rhodococcus sp. 06-621-2]
MRTLWRHLFGIPIWAAEIITNQEAIMATQAENQRRIDALGEQLDAAAATQAKAHGEILTAIDDLRRQAAEAGQELDFTKAEAAAGTLSEGAKELDDLNEDKPAVEPTPEPDVEPDTTPEAPDNPVADGASVDGAPQA